MKNINLLISELLKDTSDNSNIIYDTQNQKFKSQNKIFEKNDSIMDFFLQ